MPQSASSVTGWTCISAHGPRIAIPKQNMPQPVTRKGRTFPLDEDQEWCCKSSSTNHISRYSDTDSHYQLIPENPGLAIMDRILPISTRPTSDEMDDKQWELAASIQHHMSFMRRHAISPKGPPVGACKLIPSWSPVHTLYGVDACQFVCLVPSPFLR